MNQSVSNSTLTALQMVRRYADLELISLSLTDSVLLALSVPAGGLGNADYGANIVADRNAQSYQIFLLLPEPLVQLLSGIHIHLAPFFLSMCMAN